LTCPAAFTVTGVIGSSQPVTYGAPTASGETAVDDVVCTPPSGSSFNLGATTVACRARDRLGREASCGFVVTLQAALLGVKKFVAFGDSVTLGENGLPASGLAPAIIDTPNAYPTKLLSQFTSDFPGQGITVPNEGKSGERAAEGVARLSAVLATHKPGALLLLHGYNDLLNDGLAAAIPVASGLGDMVRLARASGVAHVFVSTITPSRPGSRQIPQAVILETNFQIRQMAAVEGAVLVDAYDAFFGKEAVLIMSDGLHLTPAGNEVLAQTFYTAIRNRVPASLLTAPARFPER
jgi:lysophospholipase L1-like esterase